MKKCLWAAALLLVMGELGLYAGAKAEEIRMATGGITGTYYAFGSAVGQIFTERLKRPVTVQATGASKVNIQLAAAGEVELAIVQNDVADYAWRGVDLFNGERISGFAAMAALFPEACQVAANPASGIRSIEDLRGKRVSVGDAGSGTEFNARQILEAYGLSFDDIHRENLGFGPSADALREGRIDAFFCVAGAPTVAIADLAAGMDILILEIDGEHAAALIQDYPFYTRFSIPRGSYRGQSGAVSTVAVKAVFIVNQHLSEDTVYRLTRGLFDYYREILRAHEKGAELSPSNAVQGVSIPFHPGAVRYFREIGVIK